MSFLKTVCVDFDGVIHAFISPWTQGCEVHDGPVPGAIDFLHELERSSLRTVILSSRVNDSGGEDAIRAWLKQQGFKSYQTIEITATKPPACLYIDDRAYCFEGTFPSMQEIKHFKPWNKR